MSFCSKCGKEVLEGGGFCKHCGGSLSVTPGHVQAPGMTSGLTNDDFIAFVGKNFEKYLPKFAKFNVGGMDSYKATWHWPAFFVPFWWLLYRKLYGWAALAFFTAWIPYIGWFLIPIVWALTANYIYYRHAKKKLLEIRQLHPAPETQRAVIAVAGGVGNAALIFVPIGLLVVMGILSAIAIPAYIGMQEKAKKGAVSKTISSATPELQSWLNSSLKGKDGSSGNAREVDTDGNGNVNNDDMSNAQLLNNVCNQYVLMKTTTGQDRSPWDGNSNLWSMGTGNGQIRCMQSAENIVTLTAADKNGGVINTVTITAQ